MSKHGWTYKKLGEVCEFYRGLTYKGTDEVDFSSNVVLRSNNVDLATFTLNFDDLKYINEDIIIPEDKFIKKNSLLICMSNGSKQHLGKVAFIDRDYPYAFGGFMGLIKPNENYIYPKFVYYYCCSPKYKNFLSTIGNGANINNLRFTDMAKNQIPVPPMAEQEAIVAELDEINEAIAALQQQVVDLDTLAQSTFYDMFGDPYENIHNWMIKSLNDVCDTVTDFVAAGSFASLRENVEYINNPDFAQLVRTVDLKSGFSKKSFVYVNEHAYNFLWRVNLDKECIILPNVGVNCGEIYFVKPTHLPYNRNVLGPNAILVRSDKYNHIFLMYYFRTNYFQALIEKITNAVGQPKFNKTDLKKLEVFLPPLSLQQDFAAKVEAIEAAKAELNAQIAEMQTLLASRMDYYFD